MNQLTTKPAEADDDLQLATQDTSTASLILDDGKFEKLMAIAEIMATGRSTIPKHLQGNKGDCLAVVIQATQWKMNPFAVAQKTHIVNGTLGYEAQLVNAVITTSGAIEGRPDYDWFGPWEKIIGKFKTVTSNTKKDDDGKPKTYIVPDWDPKDEVGLGVRVFATVKGEAAPRVLELLLTQVRTRNSTLWTEDPKQQIGYLAIKRWSRLHTPDVMLGVYTPDELSIAAPKDMGNVEEVPPANGLSEDILTRWAVEASKGMEAARKFWAEMTPEQRRLATDDQKERMRASAAEADAKRTVDTPAARTAEAKTTAAAAPAAAAKAEEKIDPATGEVTNPNVDPDFIAGMDAVDAAKDAAK